MKTGKVIRYHNKFTEQACRLLLSFNMLILGFLYGDTSHSHPLDVLVMTLIAFWLYLYRFHIAAIILLMLTSFINYQHIIS